MARARLAKRSPACKYRSWSKATVGESRSGLHFFLSPSFPALPDTSFPALPDTSFPRRRESKYLAYLPA
jgi:hypothetical protein